MKVEDSRSTKAEEVLVKVLTSGAVFLRRGVPEFHVRCVDETDSERLVVLRVCPTRGARLTQVDIGERVTHVRDARAKIVLETVDDNGDVVS